jgi:hypothetical protein
MLAIALNFCLLYAIGLGTIDAAVRLRSCDCALASRIVALSLTLSIHLFTSRRAGSSPKLCGRQGPPPLSLSPLSILEDLNLHAAANIALPEDGGQAEPPNGAGRLHERNRRRNQ